MTKKIHPNLTRNIKKRWVCGLALRKINPTVAHESFCDKTGYHSAKIILKSIDYHDIMSCYGIDHERIAEVLLEELSGLVAFKPDCIMICCNSLHKYYQLSALNVFFNQFTGAVRIRVQMGHFTFKTGLQPLLNKGCSVFS